MKIQIAIILIINTDNETKIVTKPIVKLYLVISISKSNALEDILIIMYVDTICMIVYIIIIILIHFSQLFHYSFSSAVSKMLSISDSSSVSYPSSCPDHELYSNNLISTGKSIRMPVGLAP